ncbi:hypothetical protein PPYR_03041 [Photinus pyralis]|uniref:Phospholipase A2 n=1 Tax=Photinus pyralis TaxID=7054 RepID=A0A5N4A1R9_PHOPY|nr:phospholipase A2 phaiodactylipin-like isoform X3 [Photinus pyralis]XP_031332100.1 phospholipase A2 phaiodactylipin-like isoform X3 [Photinus pyralis]KAB0791241.1 hypothetical protein PPYR_03041 [Photinus pyralis]
MRILLILLACLKASDSHLFIADRTMSRMIEFTTERPYCIFFTDRDFIQHTLLNAEQRKVKITSSEEIDKLEEVCKKRKLQSSYQGGFIYPGTKWCGPGAVADNYTDLGSHSREDMCCREHDHCPHYIEKGECKQGICNKSSFTRSHCDCDANFRRCLQNVNSETANTIGAIFFNVVQVICFKQRNPCSEFQSSERVDENAVEHDKCGIEFAVVERYEPSRTFCCSTRGEKRLH